MLTNMADKSEITGYIHNVSPVLLARNERTRYFTGEHQTSKTESLRLICFAADQHAVLKGAEVSPEAFTLKDALISPSKKGKMEVKMTRSTVVTKSKKKLDFSKTYMTLMPSTNEQPSQKINLLTSQYQMASVNIKYLGTEERDRLINTKYGQTKISIAVVSDDTDVRKFVIWSEELIHQFEPGHYYHVTNIQNRMFDNQYQLNTTKATVIHPIPAFENAKTNLDILKETELKNVVFLSVSTACYLTCSVCKKPVNVAVSSSDKTVKCSNCNFKQLASAVTKSVSVTVMMADADSSEAKKCIIKDETIRKYLARNNQLELINELDALEDFLIIQKQFNVKMNKDGEIITSLKNATPSEMAPASNMS